MPYADVIVSMGERLSEVNETRLERRIEEQQIIIKGLRINRSNTVYVEFDSGLGERTSVTPMTDCLQLKSMVRA